MDSFVTLFHARIDLATRRISYVDAGHGHGFVSRASGTIELPSVRSMPLGMPFHDGFREGRLCLRAGDALILYTDGLLEALPEQEVSLPTLGSLLVGANTAATMLERLVDAAATNAPAIDDLTVVVVRATLGEVI